MITGLPPSAYAYLLARLTPLLEKKPVFWLQKTDNLLRANANQLDFWNKIFNKKKVYSLVTFPAIESVKTPNLNELLADKLKNRQIVLNHLLCPRQEFCCLLLPSSLKNDLPSPSEIKAKSLLIKKNELLPPDRLIKKLRAMNYTRAKQTTAIGQFSLRGDIIDIYSSHYKYPIKISLLGDLVENINFFDPRQATTHSSLEEILILPSYLEPGDSSLLEYLKLNPQTIFVLESLPEIADEFIGEAQTLTDSIFKKFSSLQLAGLAKTNQSTTTADIKNLPSFHGNLKKLAAFLSANKDSKIFIFSEEKDKIINACQQNNVFLPTIKYIKESYIDYPFLFGFADQANKIIFLTDREIFLPRQIKRKTPAGQILINKLSRGDLVVHLDHGIGIFQGMTSKQIDGGWREFYEIEYAGKDKLFLPVEYSEKISSYVGAPNPKINRLHGYSWQHTKEKITANSRELAKVLLKTYAKRELANGQALNGNPAALQSLEESFPYQETPDQLKAWEDVKNDLLKNSSALLPSTGKIKPMDRVICGDVGFGKTEIAIRASLLVASSKKQVALLAPTTILAQQHFDTFTSRLKKYRGRIGLLSRFQNHQAQQTIIEQAKNNQLDIIIGTHRLLSPDVKLPSLGLVIIDEEQKFGVKQKEKIKELKAGVDVLTLTATPIPRTLNLSLAGLRDISMIATPPAGRKEIQTFIEEYSETVIKQAILQEMARQGQTYLLYNKVATINIFAKKIASLVPSARIGIAHGQLPEKELAEVMQKFDRGEFDVLLCSSIIENGLDLPNANTLIVTNATNFGLADLYQIRGRIGRSEKQGYAYFLYHTKKLKANAKKRLTALLQARKLGQGFALAMRDLEIRGAGNILGKEQAGNINSVGLNLYIKLLNQTIEEIKTGLPQDDPADVTIDLPIDAYLPPDKISDYSLRAKIYQQLAACRDAQELVAEAKKITMAHQLSSSLPFANLLAILQLKIIARRAQIISLDTFLRGTSKTEKTHYLVIKLRRLPSPSKINTLFQRNPAWDLYNKKLSINLADLGQNWLSRLIDELTLLV